MTPVNKKELEQILRAAEPLVKILRERFDPHTEMRIDAQRVVILTGICSVIAPEDLTVCGAEGEIEIVSAPSNRG